MDERNEAMPSSSPADEIRPDQADEAQMEQDRPGQTHGHENDQNQKTDTITEPIDERLDLEERVN